MAKFLCAEGCDPQKIMLTHIVIHPIHWVSETSASHLLYFYTHAHAHTQWVQTTTTDDASYLTNWLSQSKSKHM